MTHMRTGTVERQPATAARATRDARDGVGRARGRRGAAAALLVASLVACGTDPSDRSNPAESSTPISADEWRAFEDLLRERAEAGQFSGAVLVTAGGETLAQAALGLADRDAGQPNTLDTRFNIGSLAKMFTAVAIAQLVEQGRLDFDDPIGDYVAGFPEEIASSVTVDQLLTHTSGLGDFMRNGYPDAAKSAETATDLLPLITDQPLLFEPGTRESYSNSGYAVLGAIIEAITGESYYDYVRANVFERAGMTRTDWSPPPGQDMANTARGYMRTADAAVGALTDNTTVVPWGNPSGGAYSTVGDLQRFGSALMNGQLLRPDLTSAVITGKVTIPDAGGAKTGYGFTDGTMNGVRIVGHGAGAAGVSAAIDIYPDSGSIVVVLSNYDDGVGSVQARTRQILTGA